jgi:hypothetical protein
VGLVQAGDQLARLRAGSARFAGLARLGRLAGLAGLLAVGEP